MGREQWSGVIDEGTNEDGRKGKEKDMEDGEVKMGNSILVDERMMRKVDLESTVDHIL